MHPPPHNIKNIRFEFINQLKECLIFYSEIYKFYALSLHSLAMISDPYSLFSIRFVCICRYFKDQPPNHKTLTMGIHFDYSGNKFEVFYILRRVCSFFFSVPTVGTGHLFPPFPSSPTPPLSHMVLPQAYCIFIKLTAIYLYSHHTTSGF